MGGQIYMDYVNDKGGVHGRKNQLVVEDNGILPNTTLQPRRRSF
jgi:ABC-type branched-subunit amino acid transport system substrate-binding protein